MMTRTYATQEQIHESIASRLIAKIDEWHQGTCYTSDEPNPTKAPPHDVFCTVVPMDGVFDEAMFDGGGTDSLCEKTTVAINVFSFVRLGESGHTDAAIFNPSLGLLSSYKPRILRALLLDWEPTFQGRELLRNMLRPDRSIGPQSARVNNRDFLRLTITFAIEFDWDLGE